MTDASGLKKYEGGIEGFLGKMLYPLNPRMADIDIEEIAHALSQKCRFTGHSREFYSVAQHSVIVSDFVGRELALAGLLHDGSEYLLPDVSSPLKPKLRGFVEIEEGALDVIFRRFGILKWRHDEAIMAEVKDADIRALALEVHHLMHPESPYWAWLPEPDLDYDFEPWEPKRAKRGFLDRFYHIIESSSDFIAREPKSRVRV